MKTVLFIDSSGLRYFQPHGGQWRRVTGPTRQDTLWVLVNLPDEMLEVVSLPRLYGKDRSNFLERRLADTFPGSTCRAVHLLAGSMFSPGKVMLTGLSTVKDIADQLAPLETNVAGLWGVAALLTLMAKRFALPNVLVILPGAQALRILVVKDQLPILTRYVYCEGGSSADEILLTRQYLENQRLFERGKPPPVLYLGDASALATRLTKAGLTLLATPKGLQDRGEAGWLHPLFNQLVSSPPCQLAPLPWRAKYLGHKVRWTAYAGVALSWAAACYYGQADMRAIIALQGRLQTVQTELQKVAEERVRLAERLQKSGADPELVHNATQLEAQEITAAPSGEAFLPLAAMAIAEVPEARVQALSFRLAAEGELVCQDKRDLQPLDNQVDPGVSPPGVEDAAGLRRQAEVQLTVRLPADFSPQAKTAARWHISATLRGMAGVKLWQDPVITARQAILTGGAGATAGPTEEYWCLSVPWRKIEGETPAVEGEEAL